MLGCCFFRARDGAGLVRKKIRPARLVGDKSGTKLSQQEQNAPNEAILGEQGEFYTENAAARLVQGEFCTGTGGVRGLLLAVAGKNSPSKRKTRQMGQFWTHRVSFVPVPVACGSRWASFSRHPALHPGLVGDAAPSMSAGVGVLQH